MSEPLTKRQHAVMETIEQLQRGRGYMPSVREIGRELELSAATVQEHLVALERKGYIRRSGSAFGLQVLAGASGRTPGEDVVRVSVRGTIAAGKPIEAIEDFEESVDVPASWVRQGEHYALRVQGFSMKDDLIVDGDIVLVQRDAEIRNGDKAVCLLEDGTATLKRAYRERSRWCLKPANPDFKPIYARNVEFQGKVIAIYRREA